MPYDVLIEKTKNLSAESLKELGEYIDFLQFKARHPEIDSKGKQRSLNRLSGKLKYMADDFDQTPAEFAEYV